MLWNNLAMIIDGLSTVQGIRPGQNLGKLLNLVNGHCRRSELVVLYAQQVFPVVGGLRPDKGLVRFHHFVNGQCAILKCHQGDQEPGRPGSGLSRVRVGARDFHRLCPCPHCPSGARPPALPFGSDPGSAMPLALHPPGSRPHSCHTPP